MNTWNKLIASTLFGSFIVIAAPLSPVTGFDATPALAQCGLNSTCGRKCSFAPDPAACRRHWAPINARGKAYARERERLFWLRKQR